jgi:Stress responsive A/B Barrel Domain
MSAASDAGRLLAHNVFFSLHDRSEAARARLIAACRTHLAPHAGVVFFACGGREPGLARDVNDLDFDVALHVVFTDRAAHDAYQTTPAHLRFIAENKENWKKVRVFDSLVTQSPATAR